MMLAVFEPHSGGHRANYARWTAEGLRAANHEVVLAGSPELLAHPVMHKILRCDDVSSVSLRAPDTIGPAQSGGLRLLRRQLLYRAYFAKLYSMASVQRKLDGVVIPYLDYCLYAFAALGAPFGEVPWCGITMRMDSTALRRNAGLQALGMRMLCRARTLRSVFTIDPRFGEEESPISAESFRKLLPISDPVDELQAGNRQRIRLALDIPDKAVVVLVFGTLDSRKGIEQLLLGMTGMHPSARITALLVGRQSPTLRALVSQPRWQALRDRGALLSIDRYVPDSEVADLLAGSDAAWLGYVGHQHTSGVLILAAISGLPIIATRVGAIGYLADRMSLTTKVSPGNTQEVADALSQLGLEPRRRRDPEECRQVARAHSPTQFGTRIAEQFEAPTVKGQGQEIET